MTIDEKKAIDDSAEEITKWLIRIADYVTKRDFDKYYLSRTQSNSQTSPSEED